MTDKQAQEIIHQLKEIDASIMLVLFTVCILIGIVIAVSVAVLL